MGKREEGKTSEKSREKGSEGQRTKPPTPTRANDALIGKEEQNGKQKKETAILDHSEVKSFIIVIIIG